VKEWSVSHQVDCDGKSTSLSECTHVQLCLRIEKLEQLHKKILQGIKKKQSCHYSNNSKDSSFVSCKQPNTTHDCSHKSIKVSRHQISPDTSSQQRKGITGHLKSKINSNLNYQTFSRAGNSIDLNNLMKNKNSLNLIIELFWVPYLNKIKKNLVAKVANKTQSEITAKLLDPKLSGVFLNSVNLSFKSENGGTVTAAVAKLRIQLVTKNQTQQRIIGY